MDGLSGLTSDQLAEKVIAGEITKKAAETFVAGRAKDKLNRKIDARS